MPGETLVNTGVPWPSAEDAAARVLEIQTKLHRWAGNDPSAKFDDLFNLVADPGFLMVAWGRVRSNTGARTAGVDGWTARQVEQHYGVEQFLSTIRELLRSGQFTPKPVRERLIPKPGTAKFRRLGIPTVIDRTVQAALKLVLEPIFEAEFQPCSYGFRPGRRAQDAIAEIQLFTTLRYKWVLEADIEACFDTIDHTALMDRVRRRVGDKRVLALVKAFLKAGVLTETDQASGTFTGTPQGGILSPLLANIALSVLDDRLHAGWLHGGPMSTDSRRQTRRRKGLPNWRLVRYADDFVVLVTGTREDAEQLREEVAATLAPMGLRLSEAKTAVVHIDEGFDFLGFRIQRHRKRGTSKHYVYTYPSKKSLNSITAKVRAITWRNKPGDLAELLGWVNAATRGWCNYFKHGVSKATFSYLRAFTWRRVVYWIRKRHPRLNWATTRRRFLPEWVPTADGVSLFNPGSVAVTRYRYRGAIPAPWATA
ncbi:group II intron reverse transcriptase/maturase [Actinoplanes regularis]|uniref:RNA-directed DNA polymerase n=1 Tax=Actinoplanes regularis TaxID=52697 RepID=A0A238YRL2_9ACTN|nr:group II intron reverse transcriptase/maturase [Actinoplanes regularis]GIE85498.1 group II intron reverse transcriptase/maturase [Actinoplanes regularis]SNR73612.1 RNA-directed DNA polymerase [Actinoplanes regularis]